MISDYDYNFDHLDGVDYAEAIEYLAEYDRITRERLIEYLNSDD